jgi:hypothetical protein
LIRKKVDPQTAVTPRRSAAASRDVRRLSVTACAVP